MTLYKVDVGVRANRDRPTIVVKYRLAVALAARVNHDFDSGLDEFEPVWKE